MMNRRSALRRVAELFAGAAAAAAGLPTLIGAPGEVRFSVSVNRFLPSSVEIIKVKFSSTEAAVKDLLSYQEPIREFLTKHGAWPPQQTKGDKT